MKKVIASKKAPAAIGPYSQGILAGNMLYISGQLPIDAVTGQFAGDDIKSQTKQSLDNILYILDEAGFTVDDVVKTTVFLKNINDFVAMNEVYSEYFKNDCPARAAFQVGALPKDAKVEIEVVAYKA